VYKKMIRYAVNVFRKLPHAAVYIDGQSSDWSPYDLVASLLAELGVGLKGVRGFTLGQTHMAPDADQYKFGRAVVEELAKKHGIKNRYFIVNREFNGYPLHYGSAGFNKNIKCTVAGETDCFALGRPPYVYHHDKWCDGFLWFGTFGMDTPSGVELAGMASFSPNVNYLPPSSAVGPDYEDVLAKLHARYLANTDAAEDPIVIASLLRDSDGKPDSSVHWYKAGDPKRSSKCQRSPWHAPQLHPCKRSDYGTVNGVPGKPIPFVWPSCATNDVKGYTTYNGPKGGIADPVRAKALIEKKHGRDICATKVVKHFVKGKKH